MLFAQALRDPTIRQPNGEATSSDGPELVEKDRLSICFTRWLLFWPFYLKRGADVEVATGVAATATDWWLWATSARTSTTAKRMAEEAEEEGAHDGGGGGGRRKDEGGRRKEDGARRAEGGGVG